MCLLHTVIIARIKYIKVSYGVMAHIVTRPINIGLNDPICLDITLLMEMTASGTWPTFVRL